MNSDVIKGRVKQLEDAVAQSVVNHNILVGQLQEAKVILEEMIKEEEAAVKDENVKEAEIAPSADVIEAV